LNHPVLFFFERVVAAIFKIAKQGKAGANNRSGFLLSLHNLEYRRHYPFKEE
jgi:hypothetical protein